MDSEINKMCQQKITTVMLSMHRDPNIVLQALEVGAMAYVVKDAAPEELVKAIQEVQRGNHYLGHRLAIDVATSRTPSRPHNRSKAGHQLQDGGEHQLAT
jgi:DNA-binding NarL/FixJ family response regulator